MEKIEGCDVRISQKFVTALAIVSIIGFVGIISQSFFNFNLSEYIEFALMLTIGVGLIMEAKINKLKSLSKGITSNNLTHLTTVIIGFIAILAGIFSFPLLKISNPSFLAIKGIVSIIAIAVIAVQTWIIGNSNIILENSNPKIEKEKIESEKKLKEIKKIISKKPRK